MLDGRLNVGYTGCCNGNAACREYFKRRFWIVDPISDPRMQLWFITVKKDIKDD